MFEEMSHFNSSDNKTTLPRATWHHFCLFFKKYHLFMWLHVLKLLENAEALIRWIMIFKFERIHPREVKINSWFIRKPCISYTTYILSKNNEDPDKSCFIMDAYSKDGNSGW